ncbi:hypothetical protein SCP_0905410 [Sparassis crispa]|uniref:Kinetochore protein Sos7 coiled-coil domain-containing protein n=1 Tax=Sparassis crispa TaxID=139825 RepID=A0A401GWR3_9APHY|nr:hypothetical protein SCP_0905410 [Sparassis crispa]GBE86661.1 hypothetical protein SCP_0905410 [Sparassis crispa]
MSLEVDHTAKIDAARSLQAQLQNTRLYIVGYREQFDTHHAAAAESGSSSLYETRTGLTDPAVVAVDVASQIAFLRKLKIQYLEQKAKDQYIKTIVSPDAPNIDANDNEKLRVVNEAKKEALKAAKAHLAEKDGDIRKFAPLVEQDYNKAKLLTDEAFSLASQILDARLTLTRLRSAHPLPRLTIPAANAQLDVQVIEMQKLDDALQGVNENIERVKEAVKDGAREFERLRVERADMEKLVQAEKDEGEDETVIGLYDWYTASLALHRSLLSLETFHFASENELHLKYAIPRQGEARRREVQITLLFVPNTRQLADAQIEGLSGDLGDIVGAHIQANDVPGLIAAVLARARAER